MITRIEVKEYGDLTIEPLEPPSSLGLVRITMSDPFSGDEMYFDLSKVELSRFIDALLKAGR